MTRRTALAALGSLSAARAADPGENFLLVSQAELASAHSRAQRLPWAAAALHKLLAAADTAYAAPVNIPARGGQWGHWYSCPVDGVELVPLSPTRHRCPQCGRVYTGDPYDAVLLTRIHAANSAAMRDMALAFRFTGRPELAHKTAHLLLAYSRQYLSYPRHDNYGKDSVNGARITSQTLDESTWLIPVVWAYALIRSTLPAADRQQIESQLLLPAAATIIGPSFAGLANIQCWKDSAVGCVGFALGNHDLISAALADPVRGFETLMSTAVLPGGSGRKAVSAINTTPCLLCGRLPKLPAITASISTRIGIIAPCSMPPSASRFPTAQLPASTTTPAAL